MADYKYSQLDNVAVDIVEDAITLNMKTVGPEEQKRFNFETHQKEDIANLIASYSPAHGNWQRVGEARTKNVRRETCKNMQCLQIILHTGTYFHLILSKP